MFENRYDIAYKLLIAAFILMALYSMFHSVTLAAGADVKVNSTAINPTYGGIVK